LANALYDKGRQKFLEGGIAVLTDTIKVALATSSYTPNLSTDEFLSDLGATTVGTAQTLGSKTSTAGVFDAADITYTALSGSAVSYIVIYKDTGSSATSPLIALIDTATGMPFTPSGGNVSVVWDNGSNKIFKL